jgi:hypothetical protein
VKCADDLQTGVDFPAQLISHLQELAGFLLSLTASE